MRNPPKHTVGITNIVVSKDDPKVFWNEKGFRREPEQAEFVLPGEDFVENEKMEFSENFEENMLGAKEVAVVSGPITKLNTPAPFINQINIVIPEDLQMQIYYFP